MQFLVATFIIAVLVVDVKPLSNVKVLCLSIYFCQRYLTRNRITRIIRLREPYYITDTVWAEYMISFEEFILENDGPIYLQIIRYIKQGIAAGTIGDQEEVPSRRMLSALLGVNPNTIQKAYHLLEEEGILLSRSGAKSYICADPGKRNQIRQELLRTDTGSWIDAMKSLKLSEEEALELARHMWEEKDYTDDSR